MQFKSVRRFLFHNIKSISLIVIALGLIGYLVFQVTVQKSEYIVVRIKGSPGNWWWVTPRPPDWLANAIHVGDKEFNAVNKPTAEVLGVDVFDAGGPTKDVFLTTRLEVRYNKRTGKYRYKGEPVEIGGPVSLSLNNTFFPGMVVDIYGPNREPKQFIEKTVTIRHNLRWPYEYDAIVIGDTIRDGEGNVIAEIIKKERRPAEREGETWTGQITKAFSPVYDDFIVTVKVKATQNGDDLVFREEQYMKVGNKLWLLFPHYNLSAVEIVSIE